jgi:catechol 2,3-dioxygenase-like lactoylglutathione lyase family enzyme
VKIIGAHSIIYTTNADADRAFLRDVLKLPNVDVGHGWLIFGLPPAEVAVHPASSSSHELYLMCDDIEAFASQMRAHGLTCEPVQDQRWGLTTTLILPGGGKLGVYQPRHARPKAMSVRTSRAPTKARKHSKPKKSAKKTAVRVKASARR